MESGIMNGDEEDKPKYYGGLYKKKYKWAKEPKPDQISKYIKKKTEWEDTEGDDINERKKV